MLKTDSKNTDQVKQICDEEISYIETDPMPGLDSASNANTPVDPNIIMDSDFASDFYSHLLSDLAIVGRTLANTYSEKNQETGSEFSEALDALNNIDERIRQSHEKGTLPKEHSGLQELSNYLRREIERRSQASLKASVNY